jgi:hypothetical protein
MNAVQLPKRKAFLSTELQQELEAKGFVKLNLLQGDQVSSLLDVFKQQTNSELTYPFYTSNWSKDVEYRKIVDSKVRPILESAVSGILDNYKCNFSYFLVKRPNLDSEFRVHQDWSMIDETQFTGLTLWVALSDTKVENGCFHVVEKSHLFSSHSRGSGIESPYSGIKGEIEKKYCSAIEMKKGEALIFDHRLWHFSPPNLSNEDRVAAGMVLIPKETTFLHYFLDPESGMVRTYQADDSFLYESGFGDDISSKGYELIDEKPFSHVQFDDKLFEECYFTYNNNKSRPKTGLEKFVERLFG